MARRRTLYQPVMIAAAVAVACAVALLVVSEKAGATFPGKNGRIAYAGWNRGKDFEIYTIKPDGSGKTQLTHNNTDDHDPAFSPDGKKIVYSGKDGPKGDLEIYTIGARGGDKFQVTNNDVDEQWPAYSPDGKRIAYTVLGGNSARQAFSESSQGFKPSGGKGPAYNASEKLQLIKTASGARVTLNWVYAEENYVSIGYQVEDLKDDRRVAGHPAELQPVLGFGYGKPTPREEEYLKKSGLGTDIVALTDERSTKFRMVDNSVESSYGKPAKGPLENMVAFKPKEGLKPSKDHDFRLRYPSTRAR